MAKKGPTPPRPSSTKRRTTKPGRYVSAEERGRYTAPVPKDTKKSPRWFGPLILVLMIGGLAVVALNYLNELPGAVSPWYLVGGLVAIFASFYMATQYK